MQTIPLKKSDDTENMQTIPFKKSNFLHVDEFPFQYAAPFFFHPVKEGDVYNEHYKVIRKLGNGTYSTCWLSEDFR